MAGDGGAVAAHDELVVAEEVELRVADVAFGDRLAGGILLRVAEEEQTGEDERLVLDEGACAEVAVIGPFRRCGRRACVP